MSLLRIDQLFSYEKGSLQSSKCLPGEYNFITAASEWKTNKSYSHDCEALVFAAAASGSLGRIHYVKGKFTASDLCFILTPKDNTNLPIDLKFYQIIFNLFRTDIVKNTKAGTSKEAIGLTRFGQYKLPYFDIEQQELVKEQIGKIEELKTSISDENFHQLNLISQLRQAFLREAMQGKLVPQNPDDEPATELLKRIKAEKEKLIVEGKIKKQKPLPEIKQEEIPFDQPKDLTFVRLQDICHIEKGNIGIMKATPGEYPLVTLSEKRLSDKEYYFDCKAIIIPIISSAGHGKAEMKRMHYQEGKFSVGNILCAVYPFNYENFNARFLFEYMNNYKHDFFVKKMRGAANVSLRLDAVGETPVPVVAIKTQNKFEELMQLLDELEKNINQSKEETNLLLQTVLREALEGKEK